MFRAAHRSKHVEPLKNFGIINSITKLHLVGISTESSTMHGSMSIETVYRVAVKTVVNVFFMFKTMLDSILTYKCLQLFLGTSCKQYGIP
jgi:hypothetical protein